MLQPVSYTHLDVYKRQEYRFNGAHPKYTFLNEKEINDYLRRGIDVNTWTVDSDDIKDFLVDEGVKTIITNKDIQGKKALDFFSSSKLSSDTSVSAVSYTHLC